MSTFENSFGSDFYTQKEKQEPCFGISIQEKEFRRSQHSGPSFGLGMNKQKINIKEYQFQQKMVMLKIQLKIQTIIDILELKQQIFGEFRIQNRKKTAFQNLKQTQNPQQVMSMHRTLCAQTMEQIFNRISSFVKRQRIKQLSKGFSHVVLRNILVSRIESSQKGKKKVNERRDSQILKANSKIDENSMHLSDLMVDGEGSNYSSSVNPKLKNKQLKKKKQKLQQYHEKVLEQFNQMLDSHEHYIKKI